jgi:hypothetical protein
VIMSREYRTLRENLSTRSSGLLFGFVRVNLREYRTLRRICSKHELPLIKTLTYVMEEV